MPTAAVLGVITEKVCDQIDEARKKAIALGKNTIECRPLLDRNKVLIVAVGA